MCGIFFSVGFKDLPPSVIDSVAHRGPDGRGWNTFFSPQGPVVMAHRRLAIIDLSSDGHQPMSCEDGRFWVTYNGEIYNYIEIRKELEKEGYVFRTQTDTEVLLKSYAQWGEDCLSRFNGMFAFVIWDDKEKKVFAARDRFGVKPLYYYKKENSIAFASEIKQLLNIPGFERMLNKDHLVFFLSKKYYPISDSTLFNGVKHLEPGHFMSYNEKKCTIIQWYKPHASGLKNKNFKENFLELFKDSLSKRLLADVPVGALLSGGLDSSSIVCMLSSFKKEDLMSQTIETFTSWSSDPHVNEKVYSDAIVSRTGFFNHLVEIKEDTFQSDIENIIYHQEEPFLSTSIHSEWNIYKAISHKTRLKVVLDGQGSDELTCGYLFMMPHLLAQYIKGGCYYKAFREFLCILQKHKNVSGKALILEVLFKTYPQIGAFIQNKRGRKIGRDFQETFSTFYDYTLYLIRRSIEPQLRWQDRSSMAFSIESRQPFLDYRLVEFLLSLPLEEKFKYGITKKIIRHAMKGILPESVRQRVSKFGFPSPQNSLMESIDPEYFKKYFEIGFEILKSCNFVQEKGGSFLLDTSIQGKQNEFFLFSLGMWANKFEVKQ